MNYAVGKFGSSTYKSIRLHQIELTGSVCMFTKSNYMQSIINLQIAKPQNIVPVKKPNISDTRFIYEVFFVVIYCGSFKRLRQFVFFYENHDAIVG